MILAARSAVPAVPAVSSRKRPGAVTDGVIQKKIKRKDGVSHAQLQRLRKIAYGGASAAPAGVLSSSKLVAPAFDPWADDAEDRFKGKDEIVREQLEFVEKLVRPAPPPTLKRKPVALAVIGSVPAVRLPNAGISYNPEFEKWDALLKEEGEKEVVVERKRLAEEAEEERMRELIDAPDPEEVDVGTDESESESESEAEEGNADEERKEAKRKTQAQRNRALRQKEQERKLDEAKKAKAQERELMLLKKYTREIKMQEKLRMAKAIAKATAVQDDEKNPKIMRKKRFGKVQYVFSHPPAMEWLLMGR